MPFTSDARHFESTTYMRHLSPYHIKCERKVERERKKCVCVCACMRLIYCYLKKNYTCKNNKKFHINLNIILLILINRNIVLVNFIKKEIQKIHSCKIFY